MGTESGRQDSENDIEWKQSVGNNSFALASIWRGHWWGLGIYDNPRYTFNGIL